MLHRKGLTWGHCVWGTDGQGFMQGHCVIHAFLFRCFAGSVVVHVIVAMAQHATEAAQGTVAASGPGPACTSN